MYMYDVTNPASFESLKSWVARVAEQSRDRPVPGNDFGPTNVAVVVANKIDIEGRTVVKKEQGHGFAESIGAEFFSVSAVRRLLFH